MLPTVTDCQKSSEALSIIIKNFLLCQKNKPLCDKPSADLKVALAHWITSSGRPTSIVENDGLREVIRTANNLDREVFYVVTLCYQVYRQICILVLFAILKSVHPPSAPPEAFVERMLYEHEVNMLQCLGYKVKRIGGSIPLHQGPSG